MKIMFYYKVVTTEKQSVYKLGLKLISAYINRENK